VHPFADLSAYLDDALAPTRRDEIAAHVARCSLCASRLAELGATARLIAALPLPAPSRSLVPRVGVPVWLAPLRTITTLASGVAALLFVASTLIASAPTAERTAAGAPGAVPAPNASARYAPDTTGFAVSSPSLDSAKIATAAGATAAPERNAAAPSAPQDARADEVAEAERQRQSEPISQRALTLSPLVWLALAVALAVVAILLQRRLRPA
jgi:anti-sigma factor RsiW